MPITKPVVFISSTAKDLQEHREAAAEAARQAGFEYQMMEDFEAQNGEDALSRLHGKGPRVRRTRRHYHAPSRLRSLG